MEKFGTYFSLFDFKDIYYLKVDGVSFSFILLTVMLVILCLIFVWNEFSFYKYFLNLFLLLFFLIIIFSTKNLLVFYIFFESVIIPMYFIIGINGSRERKIRAVYLFFYFTLIGSILMLISILYIYSLTGSFDMSFIKSYNFSVLEKKLLCISFIISFSAKIPLFPLHIWLPEAHVEAPTVGSVMLAGILLKLGVYGFYRICLGLFNEVCDSYSPYIIGLAIIGILYTSCIALIQTDAKRIIAYSSVSHMCMVTIGVFSLTGLGVDGALVQSISHGLVSSALFFVVGIFYDRFKVRNINYFGGIVITMPLLAAFYLLFMFANIALPGTSSFVGEFAILAAICNFSIFLGFISLLSVIISALYSLFFYNRVTYGNIKRCFKVLSDLRLNEIFVLLLLFIFMIIFGLYPEVLISLLHISDMQFFKLI